LGLYPSLPRDGTAFNWRRKQQIFSNSQVFVATPSRWMLQKVRESMLAPNVRDARVIPTGIDLSIFRPSLKERSRAELNIPRDAKVLLFVANGGRRNMWKDYRVLVSAFSRVVERHKNHETVLISLGDESGRCNEALTFVSRRTSAGAMWRSSTGCGSLRTLLSRIRFTRRSRSARVRHASSRDRRRWNTRADSKP
jgi:glycosyltransferase involved in cell wall biosynthesis